MRFLNKVKTLFQGRLDVNARFELLREAISGTMSEFYLARDRQTDQIVGLKILNTEKTAAFDARFKGLEKPSEGEIAKQINHSCVVHTMEYGQTNKRQLYLVMEFLNGAGLNSMIMERSSALDGHRLDLIRQMTNAVGAVHQAGFIHRDICPRNFICETDASSLKLIDFGLSLPAEKVYMQPGNRTGTPNYMAPEIVRRRATNHRVDLFALGVTIYQLCSFELPWPGGDNTGLAALAHDTDDPVDIVHRCPWINRTLADAITQCLAADPRERPASAEVFLEQIKSVEDEKEG